MRRWSERSRAERTGKTVTDRAGARPERARRLGVEDLEGRRLLASVVEFPIPFTNGGPTWITTGPDGNLWFTENSANSIVQFNVKTRGFTQYPIPVANSGPTSITSGPDGDLWFIQSNTNSLGSFNTTTHVFTTFPIPFANSGATDIISGPGNNLWFVATNTNALADFDPATRVFTSFPIPTPDSGPNSITVGPDSNLWFTETTADQIGQFIPTTRVFNAFPIPTANSGSTAITLAPDGNLFFLEANSNTIGVISPTTHGVIEFVVPTANSGLTWMAAGSDGNLWFTENSANQIGQFTASGHTFMSVFIPTPNSGPTNITGGPDGNLYFIEGNANKIGEVVLKPSPTPPAPHVKKHRGVVVVRPKIETTTQLTVAPDPATVGQAVTLTATVTIVQATTATGTVTFSIDGQAQPPVRLSEQNGVAVATLTTKLPDATHTITATYNGNSTFGPSLSNAVSLVVAPAPGDGPTVVRLGRFGFHSRPTTLVLTFDQALDPASAQNPLNYSITNSRGRSIRVASVVYDPSALTVTIAPAQRLNLHQLYRLTVNGTAPSGVTNTAGNLLDGALNGVPGSDYVAAVSGRSLARG